MSLTNYENLDLLILGDSDVGKSTLINCYLTRSFSNNIKSGVLKSKIQLPGTEYGCKSVNINLCDTRSTFGGINKWSENLEKCIIESSAILIVGSWDNQQSINRIENHWLPLVTKLCESQSIPIIILINKSDMFGSLDNVDFMNQEYRSTLCNQLQDHFMVKHVFQTSCVEIKSVVIAFDIAIQLIIYPIQQLIINQNDYSFKSIQKNTSYSYYKAISKVKRRLQSKQQSQKQNPTQIITERFLIALKRIFHILDRDNNGLLTDYEILYYYRHCLTLNSMKSHQLQRLKKWLRSVSESEQREIDNETITNEQKHDHPHISYTNNSLIDNEETKFKRIRICYVDNDCITFPGFVQLHLILVQMLQHDCIWKSLEKFGYKRKDLSLHTNIIPSIPNKQRFSEYCSIHNPILRPNIKELMSKHCKSRLQYEINPNIAGFLISIFIKYCEHKHDEYNSYNSNNIDDNQIAHDYSACFITTYGLNKLLETYNMEQFPFEADDLEMVGSITNQQYPSKTDDKYGRITLTAWISLWSLLMCYETEIAMKYLVVMGAPTMYPSYEFDPKWTDYLVPQIACSTNTHQRFFNCLIVTYPYNNKLMNQFIRASVNDFSRSDTLSSHNQYVTVQHIVDFQDNDNNMTNNMTHSNQKQNQNRGRSQTKMVSQTKMPAASRTGSLSPIKEATIDELSMRSPPHFTLDTNNNPNRYHLDDNKYQSEEEKYLYENEQTKTPSGNNPCIHRLNTVFFPKPQKLQSHGSYSYGMLNDECDDLRTMIFEEHRRFLCNNTNNRKKPLIQVNLLRQDRGIDAYHTLFESWLESPQKKHATSGQNELFEFDDKTDDDNNGFIEKQLEKNLRRYDAIIYLHTTDSLKYTQNIKRLFSICRDQQMPIIPVNIPYRNDKNQIETIDIDPDSLSPTNTNSKIITGQGTTSTIGTPYAKQIQLKHELSIEQLTQILQLYDLPERVIEWESFPEDQQRFTYDLIDDLHHRQHYIPKTLWQIRKARAIKYAKKGTMYAMGMGVVYYLAPIDAIKTYFGNNRNNNNKPVKEIKGGNDRYKTSLKNENIQYRKKKKDKKRKRKENNNNKRWNTFIAVSILTSVFYGGYYIYNRCREQNMNKLLNQKRLNSNKTNKKYDMYGQTDDDDDNEYEEEQEESQSNLSYLMSYFYSKLEDETNDDEDISFSSLTSFGRNFLKRSKQNSENNDDDIESE